MAGGAMAMMMRRADEEEMRKMGKMGHSESAPAFLTIPRGGGKKKRVRRRRDRNVRLARLDRGVVRPKSPHPRPAVALAAAMGFVRDEWELAPSRGQQSAQVVQKFEVERAAP